MYQYFILFISKYSTVWIYQYMDVLFVYQLMDIEVASTFLALMSTAAVSICMEVFAWVCAFTPLG